ncbi:MAG: hypothetical protein RR458_07080 [Clostridia bacterium]
MKSEEFIKMMYQDIETAKNKNVLQGVVSAIVEVLSKIGNPEIIGCEKVTPETIYQELFEFAKQTKNSGCVCLSEEVATKIILKCLGIESTTSIAKSESATIKNQEVVNLEDFF